MTTSVIAAYEITTAMAIGPYDLSAELGVCGDTAGPKVSDAAKQILQAAKAAGKGMWILGDGPDFIKQGFSFLCIAGPTGLLDITLREKVRHLKPAVAGATIPTSVMAAIYPREPVTDAP